MDSIAEKMHIPAHDIHRIVSVHNIFTSNRSKEIPYVSRKVKEFWEQMNAGEKEVGEVSDYHLMADSYTEK